MEVNIFKSMSNPSKCLVLPVDLDVDQSQLPIDDKDYEKVYFLRTRTLSIGNDNVSFDPATALAALHHQGFYLFQL
ncbi:hypothetical protein [Deefgea salmonis]|uniref:Uncharacterized protein n=1 Tax=Deefgea salmonis TaxID=2875502 RepID=A0ABS8BN74_9NEIS|nr:hypothetical protein [Deefgea salmonis]MCB5196996.1 hypothetical protein [Deefgea salmonis]